MKIRNFIYLTINLLFLTGCSSPKYAVKKATTKEYSDGSLIISEFVNKNEYDVNGDVAKCTTLKGNVTPITVNDDKTGKVNINGYFGKIFSIDDLDDLEEKFLDSINDYVKDDEINIFSLSEELESIFEKECINCERNIENLSNTKLIFTSINDIEERLKEVLKNELNSFTSKILGCIKDDDINDNIREIISFYLKLGSIQNKEILKIIDSYSKRKPGEYDESSYKVEQEIKNVFNNEKKSLRKIIKEFLKDETKSGVFIFQSNGDTAFEDMDIKGKIFVPVSDKNKDGKINLQDLTWDTLKGDSLFNGETISTKVYKDSEKTNIEKTTAFLKNKNVSSFYEYEYNVKYITIIQVVFFIILICFWSIVLTVLYKKTHDTKKNQLIILAFFVLSQIIKIVIMVIVSSLLMRVSDITLSSSNSALALNIFGFLLDGFFSFLLYPLAAVLIGIIPEK